MKDMAWQYAANFGVAFFGALFIMFLGRFLGAENFGLYAVIAAVPSVVNAIFDYRLQEVSIIVLHRKTDTHKISKELKILYLMDILVRILAFIISTCLGYLIIRFYGLSVSFRVTAIAALIILLTKAGNATAMGVFRASSSISTYAILQSLDWATRLGILFGFNGLYGIDLESSFSIQLLPAILFNILIVYLSIIICKRKLSFDTSAPIIGHISEFVREHRRLLLSSQAISSVDAVVKDLDTLVCGVFLLPQGVAVYKMSKNIASIAWKCVDPIFVVILPGIARYISEGRLIDLMEIIRKATMKLLFISFFLFLLSWMGAFLITYAVLGPSFRQVPLVYPFISLWIVLALPFIWTHSVAMASGNAALQAFAGALGNGLGLIALIAGAATLGVYGAAFGLSVAYAAPFVLSFFLLVKKKIIAW